MDRLTDPGYIPERIVVNISLEQEAEIYKKLCEYEDTGFTPQEIVNRKRLSGWILLSEYLPDKSGTYYLVTTTRSPKIEMAWYLHGDWYWNNSDTKMMGVIAWMPLPKPYRQKD